MKWEGLALQLFFFSKKGASKCLNRVESLPGMLDLLAATQMNWKQNYHPRSPKLQNQYYQKSTSITITSL